VEPEREERRRRRLRDREIEEQKCEEKIEPVAHAEPPLDSWVEHAIDKYMQKHHPQQREAGMVRSHTPQSVFA
jgi:hypothetical protein